MDQSANPPGPEPAEPADPAEPGQDPTDRGPDPHPLDPAIEAQVRATLAGAADVGPMPRAVGERIAGALADEAQLRVTRGPLAGQDPDADVLAPLIRSRQQPKPWLAIAAVAAAAAVVAVGGSALHLHKPANPAAVVGVNTTPGQHPATAAAHIQLSDTNYRAATFTTQVRAAINDPQTPLHSLQAEAPALGPIATPLGLEACLEALGEFPPHTVLADLARYDSRPAAIIAVTREGGTTAYVVGRSCRPGDVQILRDATHIP